MLIVDDSRDLAAALDIMLGTEEGIVSVGHVGDADAMLVAARERGADVVLCDLTMPGRDPYDALLALRADVGAVRAVAFSGYDDAETRRRAFAAGADAFLSKRAEFEEIVRTIRRVARSGT